MNWEKYSEARMKKNFRVSMMNVAIKGIPFKFFKSDLKAKIKTLEFSNAEIKMEISSDVYKFQGEATKILKKGLDQEFKRILETGIPTVVVQPYDVEYFRDLFSTKFSISDAIAALKESLIISVDSDTKYLERLEMHWNLLQKLTSEPGFDHQTWGQISPSSNEIIVTMHNKLNTFVPPDYRPFEGKELVKDLRAWNKICHIHYLEHVSFRARTLALLKKGDVHAFRELERLAQYRQLTYLKLMKVWSPLEERFMAAIDGNDNTETGKFMKTMRMRDAKGVMSEILRFSTTNRDDMAYLARVIARNLSGIAVADGAIATGAWLLNLSSAAANAGSIAPSLGASVPLAGIVFGVAAAGATGAFGKFN